MREGPLFPATEPGSREGTLVLRLDGPWTLGNAPPVRAHLQALRPPVLIVEMSGVPYIDSAAVGDLMQAYVSATNAGRIFLLAGVTNHVMALFYLIKVHNILPMYPSVTAAEKAAARRKRR